MHPPYSPERRRETELKISLDGTGVGKFTGWDCSIECNLNMTEETAQAGENSLLSMFTSVRNG